jgi:hypothetical protein
MTEPSLQSDQSETERQSITGRDDSNLARLERLRRVNSSMKWARDCGTAMIVAGATVGFGLMMSGLPIRQNEFEALVGAYGLLLLLAAFWWTQALLAAGMASPSRLLWGTFPPGLFILIALFKFYFGKWPVGPYSERWWLVEVFPFLILMSGWIYRRGVETILEAVQDMKEKRVASLPSED